MLANFLDISRNKVANFWSHALTKSTDDIMRLLSV